ncbi:HYD1 signature containing ADP-ribosyltransferase family protein [Streptomyces globisporus]
MSATFSIDGKPAGECTSPQRTFPVRGNTVSGTLKCSNPGAGPLYASVAARVQAQAQADADRCGCKVRLTYPVRANTLIDARALAKVEAKKLADQAKAERAAADCAKPHSFPTGTHVLLADGTTRPIEDIRTGDLVTASDPQTGRTATRPVTNTFTTNGDKEFTRITVTTGQSPATITATDNHPFWLPQDQQWKDAGDLRTGDELRTPNGSDATVTKVREFQGQQRTHDLTVNGLHAYYVLAGVTPVLVHNYPSGSDDAAEEMIRMRHYTNSRGKAGIIQSKVIRASDQNKVFLVPAKGKPMSPRDAERTLGIGRGRGNHVLEFDVPAGRVHSRCNSKMGITEWVADGDLAVENIKVKR